MPHAPFFYYIIQDNTSISYKHFIQTFHTSIIPQNSSLQKHETIRAVPLNGAVNAVLLDKRRFPDKLKIGYYAKKQSLKWIFSENAKVHSLWR